MKLCFRILFEAGHATAGPNELLILSAAAATGRPRNLAEIVLAQGLAALVQGEGTCQRIVVPADATSPTLDDLLAATFAGELAVGRPLPAGCASFARYAALVREGIRPGNVPLETSLEGVFLAIRAAAGKDLTDPVAGEHLATDWERMSGAILAAAREGQDPFTTSLFASGPAFARERAFLANDRQVFGQDVLRGEQWTAAIPGGPANARVLILDRPKSLLFKNWSRAAGERQENYQLLGVKWGDGQWVFSTDPIQRVPIASLAAALQAAEAAKNPSPAGNEAWFDGAAFDHTLVAAPLAGTRLSDREVLQITRRWCHARPANSGRRKIAASAAALALILVAVTVVYLRPSPWRGENNASAESERGMRLVADSPSLPAERTGRDYALIFATDSYAEWPALDNAVFDARKVGQVLADKYGFEVKLCEGYDLKKIYATLEEYFDPKKFTADSQLLIYFAGHGDYNSRAMKGYLVAHDSSHGKMAAERSATCMSLVDLSDTVAKMPCGHVFVVLDTCFGGTIDFGVATGKSRGSQPRSDVSKEEFIARKMKSKCRRYIASVKRAAAADGPSGGHSPFADRLIEALESDADQDGIVSIDKIVERVERGHQEPQYGTLPGHEPGGDFLFISPVIGPAEEVK